MIDSVALGKTLPPDDNHAVSVSIPTWKDSLDWAAKKEPLLKQLALGYPRFFVHPFITRLADNVYRRFCSGSESTKGLLFPSHQIAQDCADFIRSYAKDPIIHIIDAEIDVASIEDDLMPGVEWLSIHAIFFDPKNFVHGKSFWQHTGMGISSRRAEQCQQWFDARCYHIAPQHTTPNETRTNRLSNLCTRNMSALDAKVAIRRRIAASFPRQKAERDVDMSSVYLYPSGMHAITETYHALLDIPAGPQSSTMVAFGFVYVDTFKVLSRLRPYQGQLFGWGSSGDLDKLEAEILQRKTIKALFCEVPSNPLLSSPDLDRIRAMADKYGFLVVCDDTVASSVNIDILSKVDLVVTSLTKLFSGACNVMGGSVTISPYSPYESLLRKQFRARFVDYYYPGDAVTMEFNSRDFVQRVERTNKSTMGIVELLSKDPRVARVYHPALNADKIVYDSYKVPVGQYGYLLTILFKRDEHAIKFFDALDMAKGPSLGTNFSLACPYTLYAHYNELEWAARYGVTEHIVRISVGVEPLAELLEKLRIALEALDEDKGQAGGGEQEVATEMQMLDLDPNKSSSS